MNTEYAIEWLQNRLQDRIQKARLATEQYELLRKNKAPYWEQHEARKQIDYWLARIECIRDSLEEELRNAHV